MIGLSGGEIAAILTALGALIVAIGGTVVNVVVVLRKIDKVDAKAEVIKSSVDGAASKQVEKIESLHTMVETLRAVIADQRDTAKGLATLAAVAAEAGVGATLHNIEANTEKTAINTEPVKAKDSR